MARGGVLSKIILFIGMAHTIAMHGISHGKNGYNSWTSRCRSLRFIENFLKFLTEIKFLPELYKVLVFGKFENLLPIRVSSLRNIGGSRRIGAISADLPSEEEINKMSLCYRRSVFSMGVTFGMIAKILGRAERWFKPRREFPFLSSSNKLYTALGIPSRHELYG